MTAAPAAGSTAPGPPRRVLLTGWYSFLHGEATAGDVLAGEAVEAALRKASIRYDVAWSPRFRPAALSLDRVDPSRYSHLVFACGPVHSCPPGPGLPAPLAELHHRFAHCRRIAVGVSVPDPADRAVTGFHTLLARDAPLLPPVPDLALAAPRPAEVPVLAVLLTQGQREYGDRRRHDLVTGAVVEWLRGVGAARLPLDTRLDADDWRMCSTPAQLRALLSRADALVTTRLHGLVLGLEAGVPVLAVDPVAGGAKVSAQARVLGWPALLPAERAGPEELAGLLRWCLSAAGRDTARRFPAGGDSALLGALVTELTAGPGRADP
ncbi:polysaccharide pyruvyl transferase family protein [Kitasatospora purpeofusca]|uniref:polysaccharide pyruvyl transferase family protein n=1 Tax=Kitasatospora purpeofusca TaxID=67352 RepID=UPI002A5B010A|nr:polysaccharide pyruvyl transferase family protein [Kitasatospora purpeofusca]MDY0814539.1 polysaccharide pyruvyl transferase family protein [Kitasatospora purpeofusca]